MKRIIPAELCFLLTLCLIGTIRAAEPAKSGAPDHSETIAKVLKWKDGKKAPFLLAFDDSCPTHLKNVIPLLTQRNIVGTFYIVPGKGPFVGQRALWEKAIASPCIVLANHTWTHGGATSVEQISEELVKTNELINKLYPDRKTPRLISFGRPGGVPWKITADEQKQVLARHHLIDRPPFWGAAIHVKTVEDMNKIVDSAIARGEMGHLDFHGVGGDWLACTMEFFNAFLDKLEASKEQLWVTDAISYHKYLTERASAQIKVLESGNNQVRLQLSSSADPTLYDLPLTLWTKIPATWKKCQVTQGKTRTTVAVTDGAVRYGAVPGAEEIVLKPIE